MNTTLESILENFCRITDKPEEFISANDKQEYEIKSLLKTSYDYTKEAEPTNRKSSALPELITKNFDLEQIWQQLELQNEDFLTKSLVDISKLVVGKNKLVFEELRQEIHGADDENKHEGNGDIEESSDDNENMEDGIGDQDDDSYSSDESEVSKNKDEEILFSDEDNEDADNEVEIKNKKNNRKSVVDDDFFKLHEMEEFLKVEDKNFEKEDKDSGKDSESEELEEEDDEDDEKEGEIFNPRYKDFFRPSENDPKPFGGRRRRNDDEDDDDEFYGDGRDQDEHDRQENEDDKDEGNDNTLETIVESAPKSSYELKQERLKKKIEHVESRMVEKPWPLLGEITAENRPANSLLEKVLEFDLAVRPAPVITEKTTFQLEDVIRQRIKDAVFDSVQRKERPVDTPLEYKKKLVLDQEKSKLSLAQIYEKEYSEAKAAAEAGNEEREEEESELHKEVRSRMEVLFRQLDALSNYHCTPKPAAPELKIVSNLPAITMEEVAPVAASDANVLAPEEVKNRIKGDIIGKAERTDTDKNRERRKKKKKQQVHATKKKQKEELLNKINPGLGNKYSKEKIKKQLDKIMKDKNVDKMDETVGSKSVKSSTAFFTQLQDEVKSQIKNKTQVKRKKPQNGVSAKKFKL